ncbi:MAG: right-handed parallel beta-helix repeat-containing protein [Candidatus Thorarchaeota archaeon]
MKIITKEKITLCFLIGLFVFAIGNPLMTTEVLQERTLEKHDKVTSAYTPHTAILLDGNTEMIAQATAESWPGDGTAGDPYQITGYSFYDVQHSVEIRNIDLHWTFTDNEIDGPGDATVWCGMEISNSSNGYVANNVIFNRYRGLWLVDIEDVTITNNIIEDNLFHGIECPGYINSCLISDNTIRRCDESGIRILTGVDSEISGNSITNCDGSGIWIQESNDIELYNNSILNSGDDGFILKNCKFSLVHNNSIIGSDGIGIAVSSGANSIIRFNHIEDSTEYGLRTAASAELMEITRNVFINNGVAAQVCDEGENNTYIYNYFDEWTSPDADSDQIVDTAYSIDGAAGNEDPYPLADPNAIPPVTSVTTTTTGTSSGTGTGTETTVPMEIILIAGGAVVIIVVGIFFVKRKA